MLPVLLVLAALILAPFGASAADLVVWWDQGYNPEEDAAVREVIAAFEHESGKHAELVFHPQDEHPGKLVAAIEAGRPPDFAFGLMLTTYAPKWALEDRLVDLSEAVGHFSDLFDPDQLDRAMLLNARTDARGLYGLPIGHTTNHLHVWKSLLEQPGFSSTTSPRNGSRSGRSGATRSSRRCARHWVATTSGASLCPCRPSPTIPSTSSSSSSQPTMRTT